MSLKLNQVDLIREVIEQIPSSEEAVLLIVTGMSDKYLDRLIKFVGAELETTPHIQFYAIWTRVIFKVHSVLFARDNSDSNDMTTVFLVHQLS